MTTPITGFSGDSVPRRVAPLSGFRGTGDAPDADTLTQAVRLGGSRTPDNASRVLALQTQTGLATDVIERHLDDIERMTKERAFNPDDFRTKNPVVASWMAEHPVNAAVAQDDLANLSRIERITHVLSRGYQTGRAQSEQGRIGYDVMSHLGQMEPEQRDRLRTLDADIQREPNGRGFWTDVLYRGAQLVGQMADALPEVAEKSEVGLAGGLAASLATGPGAAVAAPVFGATGASVGAAAGFATYTYRVESGQAYLELGQLRGHAGETVDEDTKRNIALGVGMVNASLEMVGAEAVIAPFRNATRSLFRQSVRDALERPTMRAALTQFGKAYATTLATETGQEVAQEISNVVGDELSKQLSGGNFDTIFNSPEVREQTVQRLADIAEQTAKGTALIGLPGASLHGAATAVEARRAMRMERYFTALGEGVSESKTFQRLPQKVQDLVARATADGPIETVYAPVEAVNTYFQSKKIDAGAAMREVTGSDEAYQEALRTGGDIAIPMRRYAVTIAPTEHNSFFAKILRRSPSEMNALEAEQILSREDERRAQEAAAGAPDAEAAQQFEDRLTAQLMATGKFDESSARIQAKTLYSNVYRHVAERTGMSVDQLLQRLPVTVSAPENGPAPSAGPRIDLQAVADRAQAFKEAQAERNAVMAEDAPQTPYDERVTRDPNAKTETNEWVYARTSAGALRSNLASVSADGIVDEIARLLEAGQADRELEARFHAWNESAEAAFVDALPDAERTGRSRRTTDAFGNKIKRQAEDLPDASGTIDPEHLAAMRQLERDYHKASRAIEARKKVVARLEAELDRRGVTDVGERTFRRLTGGADLPDLTFQQSKLVKSYGAWAEAALDTHNSDEIREMARQRALAIQDEALKEYQADFNRANAEFAKKHGDEMASVFTDPAGLPRPRILHQGEEHVLGQIHIKGSGAVSIELLAGADLSTFLHETGHFYLHLLSELAPDAPSMAADLDLVKHAVGWQDGQTQFTVAQQEQFAKSFEAYLYEGKSPSTELRGAFARFRAWLVSVYRSLAELHLTPLLSDEVRGVFDRLLASSDEIAAAEREQQSQPLFPDPKAVGMSEKQAAKYGAAWEDARQTAQDELARKVIADFQREQSAVYQAERAKVRADVAEEVNTERDSFAYSAIARGVLPDGSPLPAELEPFKLSKQALADEYAGRYPDLLKRLRARFLYAKEGGVHPDQAAEWFGYSSGDELVQALLAYEGTPKQRIERLTDQRMQAENPNLLTSAELAVEAVKAVHNEKRAQLLRLELEHLVTGDFSTFKGLTKRISRRLPSLPEMRAQAESMIAAKAIRDVSPVLYQRAEIKAARLAQAAFLDHGDLEAAYDEKLRELLNHELYRAAVAAKEESAKIAEYMARFTKEDVRRKLGKAGGDYLEQIDAIMERFDFRKGVTLSALNSRRSLRAWYDAQVAEGKAPAIPERLLDDAYKTHFREMTLAELRDVQTTVKSIAHIAQTKNTLLASARARELETARTEIVDAIGQHHKLNVRPEGHGPDTLTKRTVQNATRYLAEHTRMEFLFDFLDGYTGAGVVWQYLFKPFADAELVENDMRKRDAEAFKAIFGQYTRAERKRAFKERIFIPEAISAKHDGSFTKSAIMSAALNWGNTYNRDALLEGYAWTEAQAQALFDKLDARDWATVQALWDHINSYWPEVEALEKAINGIAPEKVEPTPFTTKYGEMRGGYYPILFDRERSLRQRTYDEKANVTEMFGGNAFRAMTRHGHTIERTNTGGKALRLTLTGMTDHLAQVTHDLAFRRAVIDVHRLVSDDEIREAIAAAAGKDMVDQLGPWLHAIAGDRQHDYLDTAERLFTEARAGATVVGLGLKVTSSLLQTLGYANTVVELGPKYSLAGINDAFRHGNPFKLVADNGFIGERSKMMRDRLSNYDRDVRDYALRPDVLGAIGAHDSVWFSFVGYMDLATSIPTWLAAYRKGMDGKVESVTAGDERAAIDYADKVVRTTQAAGAAKDNATIQRGSPAKKLFTMFYSSLSIQFNQMDRARRQFGLDRNVPRLVGAFTMLVLVPAVLEDLVHGGGPDKDDDESWWAYLARKTLLYPAQTIILARDIASSVDRYFDTGQKDFSGSPVLNVGQSLVNTAIAGVKAIDPDKDLTEADWRAVFNTVGYIAKLPTAQVWKTAGYLYEWMTGNEQPENPFIGAYRAAVTGRPRQ